MESNECIDRISDLPDSILGKVLSYLSLEENVATSILSSRWKTIFPTHVPLTGLSLFDFHRSPRPRPRPQVTNPVASFRNFRNFVDKLLNVTLAEVPPSLEDIVFVCENEYGDDKIVSWVGAFVRLNVKDLHLMSILNDSNKLFDCLHGCSTLVRLDIGNDFVLCIPEEFFLPNLKILVLNSLVLRDDTNSVHELIAGCPVLNELEIDLCYFAVFNRLVISHPFITKVSIENSLNEWCEIVVDCPNLEALAYKGHFLADYVLKNVKSLHSVCIDFDIFDEEPYGARFRSKARRVAKLVEACSSTTRLCLTGNSLKALYHSRAPLSTFQNLSCLALGRMGNHGWRMLFQLLKSVPNLTTLTFQEKLEFYEAYECFISMLPTVCLKLHIKKIEIWEFKWTPDEIKLIEYFLENGRVLRELIIHCLPSQNAIGLQKLSMLPRHSKACQVLFRDTDDQEKFRYAREHWFGVI